MIAAARMPSRSEDDELGVIAAALDLMDRNPAKAREIVSQVKPAMFTSPAAAVLAAIQSAYGASTTPSWQAVRIALRDAGYANESDEGGLLVDALNSLAWTGSNAAALAEGAIARIHERHRKQAVVDAAKAVVHAGGDPAAVASMMEVAAAPADASAKTETAMDYIDVWSRHEVAPVVPTGFSWFDDATSGGLPVGGIVAFFAPPKSAKSAIALQLTTGAIVSDPTLTALWCRGEMTPADIGERLVVMGSRLVDDCEPCTMTDSRQRTPRARAASARVAAAVGDRLRFLPPPLTMPAIEAAVVASGARLVVIDYYQLIQPPAGGTDRVSDMDRIAGQLRDMAVRHDLAVIVISSMASGTTSASHLGQLGRWGAEIGFACTIGYAAEIERDSKGRPVKDPDGTYRAVWRCAGARSVEAQDLVLRFDGQRMTFKEDAPEGAYPEFSSAAFGGAP